MVPWPLAIEVEHQDVDGITRITTFERRMARLVYHEVDHLFGVLYRSRMKPGAEPIPVSMYKGDWAAVGVPVTAIMDRSGGRHTWQILEVDTNRRGAAAHPV